MYYCNILKFQYCFSVPGKISSSPENTNMTSTSASFSWLPPCRTNGIITKYSVTVINKDHEDNGQLPETHFEYKDTSVRISNLLPYSNYTIDVKAVTEIGPGDPSAITNFTTKIDGK